jgi:hypothetical protein
MCMQLSFGPDCMFHYTGILCGGYGWTSQHVAHLVYCGFEHCVSWYNGLGRLSFGHCHTFLWRGGAHCFEKAFKLWTGHSLLWRGSPRGCRFLAIVHYSCTSNEDCYLVAPFCDNGAIWCSSGTQGVLFGGGGVGMQVRNARPALDCTSMK